MEKQMCTLGRWGQGSNWNSCICAGWVGFSADCSEVASVLSISFWEGYKRDFLSSNTHLAKISSLALSHTGQENRCQALLNPVASRGVNLTVHSTYSLWERHLYTCECWQLQWLNIFLFFYRRFYPQGMCMGVFFNKLIKQQCFPLAEII